MLASPPASTQPLLPPGQFFGERLRSQAHGGFVYTDARYSPALRVPEHSHERALLSLLIGGGYSESLGGSERIAYRPGSVVFHPARKVHSGEIAASGVRCLHVEVDDAWLRAQLASARLPEVSIHCTSAAMSWLALRLYREFAEEQRASALIMEGIALEMVGLLIRGDSRRGETTPTWVSRVADRLRDELDGPLTVKELAVEVGVPPIRLSREFRSCYGEGIGEMHRRLRIEEACRLLTGTRRPLAEVALDLGFADQSHFTRVFHKTTGHTPAAFRRLAAAG